MKTIFKHTTVPNGSIISNHFETFDYCDSFEINIKTNESIDALLNKGFTMPRLVLLLFKIRNSIVRIFGLKTGDGRKNLLDFYPIGKRAIYFSVVDRNENEIVMQKNDKHLNFRTSLLKNANKDTSHIFLTTIVKNNNFWGRLYFLPVRPFHQIIIKKLMNNIDKN